MIYVTCGWNTIKMFRAKEGGVLLEDERTELGELVHIEMTTTE